MSLDNGSFFKKPEFSSPDSKPEFSKPGELDTSAKREDMTEKVNVPFRLSESIIKRIDETIGILKSNGLSKYAQDAQNLMSSILKDRFTVAVVGEFSKGKSTFINNLVGRDVLPTGNTPTTAMLTRIMYNANEALVIADGKNPKKTFPLSIKSWEGYTASLTGDDPSGVAFIGLNDQWLKNGIEIVDTPGAGDLEESRVALIGDALKGSDGAIITISAEVAMSMSEKLFIEERLISKKTPFLMLIITKLDRIDENQRSGVVKYIKQKLEMWNINVPVYIPADVLIPGGEFEDIIGMDKVKNQIDSWVVAPERVKLTGEWISQRMSSIVTHSIAELNENYVLSQSKGKELDELLSRKKDLLKKAANEWEEIRVEMLARSNDAYKKLLMKAKDVERNLVERLSHELSHSSNPQKWWTEDYPYRVKIEMSNFSSSMENMVAKRISEDARWFNARLDKSFKTNVLFTPDKYIDENDSHVSDGVDSHLEIKDLTAARTVSRVGVSALSIVGFMACSSIGLPPIIGSTGITTGGTVISEVFFKKKIEAQRQLVKEEMERNVPEIIRKSMIHTESRLNSMYNDIIKEAQKQEKVWMDNQNTAINSSIGERTEENNIKEKIVSLEALLRKWEM